MSKRPRTQRATLEAKVVKASGGKEREERETSEIADTPHSRFSRLLQLVDADPEAAAWIDLSHLGDLADAGYGALVSAECEIYVPDIARMLGQDGGAADALTAMIEMLPMAERLGLHVEGIPSTDELQAMSGFMSKRLRTRCSLARTMNRTGRSRAS